MGYFRVFSDSEIGEVRAIAVNGRACFRIDEIEKILSYDRKTGEIYRHLRDVDYATRVGGNPEGSGRVTLIGYEGLKRAIAASRSRRAAALEEWLDGWIMPLICGEAGGA